MSYSQIEEPKSIQDADLFDLFLSFKYTYTGPAAVFIELCIIVLLVLLFITSDTNTKFLIVGFIFLGAVVASVLTGITFYKAM